jgi:hypothetical protein
MLRCFLIGDFAKTIVTYGTEPFLRSCQLCSPSRTSQHFMEPEVSIPCSQKPSIVTNYWFKFSDIFVLSFDIQGVLIRFIEPHNLTFQRNIFFSCCKRPDGRRGMVTLIFSLLKLRVEAVPQSDTYVLPMSVLRMWILETYCSDERRRHLFFKRLTQ